MKRVVSSSLISVVVLLLIAGGFFYYQYYKGENAGALDTIPADAAWVVSCDPSSGELQRLARSGFFKGNDSVDVLNDWCKDIIRFDSIATNSSECKELFSTSPLFISGHVTGQSDFSVVFTFNLDRNNADKLVNGMLLQLTGSSEISEIRNFSGVDIHEVRINKSKRVFTWAITKGVFVGSFTSYLIEDAIRQQKNTKVKSPATRLKTYIADHGKSISIAINYSFFERWVMTNVNLTNANALVALQRVGDWSIVKLKLYSNQIMYSGVTTINDSTEFLSLFSNQKPVVGKLKSMIPVKAAAAIVWSFSDPAQFINDFDDYQDRQSPNKASEFADRNMIKKYFLPWLGEEVGLVVTQAITNNIDNQFYAVISVKDEKKCIDNLYQLSANLNVSKSNGLDSEEYNGCTIRYISFNGILPSVFGPLFTKISKFYYTIIDNHLIVANQASSLRGYINDIKTNSLLASHDRFKTLMAGVPKESNVFFYCGIPQSHKMFQFIAVPKWVTWLSKYGEYLNGWNGLVFSVANKQGVFATDGCLGYYSTKSTSPQIDWNISFDTSVVAGPFVPSSSTQLMLSQDETLTLTAVDRVGATAWKKKLESKIKGQVFEVDYYQNGSVQYLFNTSSFIYLIDSLGNAVASYPVRLPASATNGLTYSKVDSSANGSRIYIACSNLRLYGYELSGKALAGFSSVSLPDIVLQPIWLVKNGLNTYLTVNDKNGTCFFVDRTGEQRFKLKQKLSLLSQSSIYTPSDTTSLFDYMDTSGILNTVKMNGEVQQVIKFDADTITGALPIDLNGDGKEDWILATTTGIKAITKDEVTLFKYKTDTKAILPKIILNGSKVYIAFSEPGANKIHLLNRDGTLVEGFPLQGMEVVQGINDASTSSLYIYVKSDLSSVSLIQIH
jgi:hypothetical protein